MATTIASNAVCLDYFPITSPFTELYPFSNSNLLYFNQEAETSVDVICCVTYTKPQSSRVLLFVNITSIHVQLLLKNYLYH